MYIHILNSTQLDYLPVFVGDGFISLWSHMMEEHLFSQSLANYYVLGL